MNSQEKTPHQVELTNKVAVAELLKTAFLSESTFDTANETQQKGWEAAGSLVAGLITHMETHQRQVTLDVDYSKDLEYWIYLYQNNKGIMEVRLSVEVFDYLKHLPYDTVDRLAIRCSAGDVFTLFPSKWVVVKARGKTLSAYL